MKEMLVTPVFPALIGDLSQQKLVLISPIPAAVQRQYVVFEIRNRAISATKWLGIPYCMVKRRTLLVPVLAPDGKVILHRVTSFSTAHSMGRVLWNKKDYCLKLITPKFNLPPSVFYFCLVEKFNNPIEQPGHLLSTDMALSSENALSRGGMPEQSDNVVKEEVARGEIQELQAMEVDDEIPASALQLWTGESEPDIIKLLPVDPFGMGLSD